MMFLSRLPIVERNEMQRREVPGQPPVYQPTPARLKSHVLNCYVNRRSLLERIWRGRTPEQPILACSRGKPAQWRAAGPLFGETLAILAGLQRWHLHW